MVYVALMVPVTELGNSEAMGFGCDLSVFTAFWKNVASSAGSMEEVGSEALNKGVRELYLSRAARMDGGKGG